MSKTIEKLNIHELKKLPKGKYDKIAIEITEDFKENLNIEVNLLRVYIPEYAKDINIEINFPVNRLSLNIKSDKASVKYNHNLDYFGFWHEGIGLDLDLKDIKVMECRTFKKDKLEFNFNTGYIYDLECVIKDENNLNFYKDILNKVKKLELSLLGFGSICLPNIIHIANQAEELLINYRTDSHLNFFKINCPRLKYLKFRRNTCSLEACRELSLDIKQDIDLDISDFAKEHFILYNNHLIKHFQNNPNCRFIEESPIQGL